MDKMKIILIAIQLLMKFLTPDLVKVLFEKLGNAVKNYIEKTETTWDDFFLGVLIGQGEKLKVVGDAILDFGENYVLKSASTLDDVIFLPIFAAIRAVLDIPDND